MRGCTLRYSDNLSQDPFDILQHFVIPEPQNLNSGPLQDCGPIHIPFRLAGVLAAVEFHNQVRGFAEEIRVEAKERNLAAELQAFELAISQVPPELTLSVSARAA